MAEAAAGSSSAAPPLQSEQFGNIILGGKDAHREESVGTLKIHEGGFGWKSRKTGSIIAISKADLRGAEWIKIPHAYQLKLRARGGFAYKFNGFRHTDKETVKTYVSSAFGLEVEDGALSYEGWNWGQAKVEGGHLSFAVEGKQAFEMPLTHIAQATAQKNEAVVEMVDDDTALPEDELLVEMRFHIPAATGEEVSEVDGTPAEGFVELLKASGDLEQAGASLVTMEDVPVQVPRGRYDFELYDKYIKMHGKTFDWKVLYTNVAAIYLLPKPDGSHMALSITLEHPLRQGATTYPHIVLQLPREQMLETEVQLSEAECTARFGEKLDKFESGDMPSVVAKVFAAFTKKKVQGIRSGGFNSESRDDRTKSIRCSLKAVDGFLFPLDKAFYFLCNKPVLLELERVASVEFNRVDKSSGSTAARTFDLTVHMKDGNADHQFVNLQRTEYKELYRFFTAKKLRIKNIASSGYGEGGGRGGDDDDEDDDPYMARVKKEREQAMQAEMMGDDDDDDDDSDDEDFQGGSGSDVSEEYDEGDSDDSEAGMSKADKKVAKKEKKKKKKAKKEKKKKKSKKRERGSDDDESGSESEAEASESGASGGGGSDDDGSGSDDSEDKPLKKKEKKKAKTEAASPKPSGIMAGKGGKAEGKGKAEAKGKKKKAKKDKDAPKRGLSAYFIWMNTAGRASVKAEHPEYGIGEIGKACGAMWKEMDPADKSEWEGKAAADKERYEREMKEYKAKNAAADDDSDDEAPAGGDDDSD